MLSRHALQASAMVLAAVLVLILGADPALAQSEGGVGKVFDTLTGQLNSIKQFIAIGSFVLGLAVGAGGLMQFKKHAENPNAVPLAQPLTRVVIGAMLIALPTVLGVGIGTFFGPDSNNGNLSMDGDLTGIETE